MSYIIKGRKMINNIGLCGKAGAGKTTTCGIIANIHMKKSPSIIIPWAEDLKRVAREEFGWNGKKDEKGRKLIQTIGTECGRMYGGDLFWVNKWQNKVDMILGSNPNTLILNDDTRFDSEAKRIKDNGGIMIKVYGRAYDMGENSSHVSEAGINEQYIDYTIDNSGDMDYLTNKIC